VPNVFGLDRKSLPSDETKDSYKISAKTLKKLKALRTGPLAEDKISTLQEDFGLDKDTNISRVRKGFKPIMLNIEIKDATAIEYCLEFIIQCNDPAVSAQLMPHI